MRSVKRFLYTILMALASLFGCLSFLWLLALIAAAHEQSSGGPVLSALAAQGDFWRALCFTLLFAAAIALLIWRMRRERKQRSAEVDSQLLHEFEVDPKDLEQ